MRHLFILPSSFFFFVSSSPFLFLLFLFLLFTFYASGHGSVCLPSKPRLYGPAWTCAHAWTAAAIRVFVYCPNRACMGLYGPARKSVDFEELISIYKRLCVNS